MILPNDLEQVYEALRNSSSQLPVKQDPAQERRNKYNPPGTIGIGYNGLSQYYFQKSVNRYHIGYDDEGYPIFQ